MTRRVTWSATSRCYSRRTELQADGSSPGIIDPLDVLRYTITVYNNGTVPATAA